MKVEAFLIPDYLSSLLEADLEKANSSAQKADDLRERSFVELEAVEKNFNNRAEELSLELPF